jgi:hypothetical protein
VASDHTGGSYISQASIMPICCLIRDHSYCIDLCFLVGWGVPIDVASLNHHILCRAEAAVRDIIGKGFQPETKPVSSLLEKLQSRQAALLARWVAFQMVWMVISDCPHRNHDDTCMWVGHTKKIGPVSCVCSAFLSGFCNGRHTHTHPHSRKCTL